ncbi:MAG: choice-of-anchor D domain-containing protein [Phycisphaerae bacterium]|nr:choice-of-anchor D domain-containing protein [Phycisphaerae bacterium]MDW8260893.1 choice-of-anchor D domain-containing protein [Phycisphaerales bacterium]
MLKDPPNGWADVMIVSFENLEVRRFLSLTPSAGTAGEGGSFSVLASTMRPSVSDVVPRNGATGISTLVSVKVDVRLPNIGAGVSDSSVKTPGNVTLVRVRDGAVVPSNVNTTGGGDAIILTPSSPLETNTEYRFTVTDRVTDTTGARFTPFTSTFTTGQTNGVADPLIRFNKVPLPLTQGYNWTSLAIGPDRRLYAGTRTGQIVRFTLNPDGTVSGSRTIQTVRTANGGMERLITGFAFDPKSTKTNPILWVSHGVNLLEGAPNWSGKISKLTGRNLENYTEVIYNLPRSARDHLTNQPVFGPDGMLYVSVGSQSAQGAPDLQWGLREETRLSAAILRIDTEKITAPLNVKTTDAGGPYNPSKRGNPVRIYATGVRNAFDLLWTRDGKLLAPSNSSASGGNSPAGNGAPALTSVPTQNDFLYEIREGGYYGHPNPVRGEFVLNGGNPTSGKDEAEVLVYPVGTRPEPHYQGIIYDFGRNESPNGIVEFSSSNRVFGGKLNGKILVAQYSGGDNIIVLTRGPNGEITRGEIGFAGLTQFVDPLDIIQDSVTGFLYVAEYGAGRITMLTPDNSQLLSGRRVRTDRDLVVFTEVRGGQPSPSQNLTIRNRGQRALTVSTLEFVGPDAAMFSLTSAPNRPFELQPGQYITIAFNFNPPITTGNGVKSAALRIVSNDTAGDAVKDVPVRGIATPGLENANEPSLQRVLEAWRIPLTVGDDDPDEANMPIPPRSPNDEVVAQTFVKAGPGNVTIQPIAVYAPDFTTFVAEVGFYNPASGARTRVFQVNRANHQSVNPLITGWDQFDPGSSAFGIYTLWPQRQDRVTHTQDSRNPWDSSPAGGRKVRVYPLRKPDGSMEPNAYVLGFEAISSPTDHQDLVLIVRNVRIASSGNSLQSVARSAPTPPMAKPIFGQVLLDPDNPSLF